MEKAGKTKVLNKNKKPTHDAMTKEKHWAIHRERKLFQNTIK